MSDGKQINVAILAMGGEGGGVLSDWLLHVGEREGYIVQSTSVPGVAQRTGATIYYLELFPADAAGHRVPVLSLVPMSGDVDLVVASELMEAGRAVQRGLVTPDRTHLVTSTHRVFSMTEKTALGDGRVDSDAILSACRTAAQAVTAFDMARLAEECKSVISAVLLGAIAGAKCLPFSKESYEEAIRSGGVSVERSLAAFEAGYDAPRTRVALKTASRGEAKAGGLHDAAREIASGEAYQIASAGIDRTLDYQDIEYSTEYLDRLRPFAEFGRDHGHDGRCLLAEVARQLALGMTYEDTIRVAELKIRKSRFERVRAEVGARPDQVLEIAEFMHPRIEEIADTLPATLGRAVLSNAFLKWLVTSMTARGRTVRTTSLRGFLPLYLIAMMKPVRRRTLRFERETRFLTEWIRLVRQVAESSVPLAIGVAKLRNLVKGYGETHERGISKYTRIRDFLLENLGRVPPDWRLETLIAAGEADEDGAALELAIRKCQEAGIGA